MRSTNQATVEESFDKKLTAISNVRTVKIALKFEKDFLIVDFGIKLNFNYITSKTFYEFFEMKIGFNNNKETPAVV